MKVILDRHELAWPASKAEANELLRLRIKHEYLLEHLAKLKSEEAKAEAARKALEKKDKPAPAEPAKAPEKKAEAPAKPAKELTAKETIDQRYDRILRSYKEYDGIDVFSSFV